MAWPEPAVMPLSHAPLAGVAWAASIVSLDSAARVPGLNVLTFVTFSLELLVELARGRTGLIRTTLGSVQRGVMRRIGRLCAEE